MHPRVTDPRTHEWRCHSCRLLLGIAYGNELVVRYKDVELRVRGVCVHACRRCRAANSITIPREVSPNS